MPVCTLNIILGLVPLVQRTWLKVLSHGVLLIESVPPPQTARALITLRHLSPALA
jgi:hypothetical protein